MALTIVICDDQPGELEYLSRLARRWAGDTPLRLYTCGSAEQFLFEREDRPPPDILLLDVQMGAMDGISLAKKLRAEGEKAQIIFITGIADYIGEGYEVSALHYLLKPIDEAKLFAVLDRAAEKNRREPRYILLPKAGGDLRLAAEDILYGAVLSHTVTLQLKNGQESFQMRMGDLAALLGEGFFRCHRSYIVNMAHVRRVTRTAMVLGDHMEIPLARGLYEEANRAFLREVNGNGAV